MSASSIDVQWEQELVKYSNKLKDHGNAAAADKIPIARSIGTIVSNLSGILDKCEAYQMREIKGQSLAEARKKVKKYYEDVNALIYNYDDFDFATALSPLSP